MKNKVKFVSFDGGGLRGWAPAYVLTKVKEDMKNFIPREYFDVFSGTSTGALIALSIVIGLDMESILDNYENGYKIFFSTKIKKKEALSKPIYPRYDSSKVTEFVLKYVDEDMTLRDLWEETNKTLMLYATNFTNGSPVIFSTPDIEVGEYNVGSDYKIVDILKAVIAAPGYFELQEMDINGKPILVGDGGLWANNPSSFTLKKYMENYGNDDEHQMISFGNEYFEKELFTKDSNQLHLVQLTQNLIKVVTRSQMKYSSKMSQYLADKNYRFTIKYDNDNSVDELTDSFKEAVKETYNVNRKEIVDFLRGK